MEGLKNRAFAGWIAVAVMIQTVLVPSGFYGKPAFAGSMELASDSDAMQESTQSDAAFLENDLGSASPSNLRKTDFITGDLWENWDGSTEFYGEGTKECPYEIETLADLMGFSEAVAAGHSFEGEYLELKRDICLENLNVNNGSWNPIGWYRNREEQSEEVKHPFRGHFDGGGNEISGLKFADPFKEKDHIGLFGVIENGTVKNLRIEAETMYGRDDVGILAGTLKGNSVVQNVQVSGIVYAAEDAGGIAGEVTGNAEFVVIENCTADGIVVYSSEEEAFAGGIAGNLQNAYVVDCTTLTQDGDYNRIYGKGYVGGIAGRMNRSQIYNVYVNGTIGGNKSRAAGGIVGKYESGNLVLARMAGEISRTNYGSASQEGTFIGTRESRDSFTYGTERTNNLAYLFTNSAAKAKAVCGSNWNGDNSYTKSAHIGYWTEYERKYLTVSGKQEYACGDRYFYEELEDGVRYIMTQKLNRELELPFHVDHFAPGYMGEPVRGYWLSIPRVDAQNDNGTFDADVAVLSAIPALNSYYRTIDKDHAAAVAPGDVVTVLTAPKNTGTDRYQMVIDETEAGGVVPPRYLDEQGNFVPMQYVNGGSYSFVMPECDTELWVEYQKVTTVVSVEPLETTISIVHTRSGDRKMPDTVTEVKNDQGILIARYIQDDQDQSLEVQPIRIYAANNGTGNAADQTVRWSVDDQNLLINQTEPGYTRNAAKILPNIKSSFVTEILNREIAAQANHQYQEKIDDRIYSRAAVVTAAANPDTSADGQAVYGNCRVNVTFQIVDQTTLRVDGMKLNQEELVFTVTRRLTGKRSEPKESYQVTGPVLLSAYLNPQQPFWKNVSWSDRESGKIIRLEPTGEYTQECRVMVNYDASGVNNPAWIQNIILEDRAKQQNNPKILQTGSGTYTEMITAVSEDQTNGHIKATCKVTIRFVTEDETYLRSSSGGSSGGSSSGKGNSSGRSSSSGATAIPSYVITGTWQQREDGAWLFFKDAYQYQLEWAAVMNPYANTAAGQKPYAWFYFDENGIMVTGWRTIDGKPYYFHEISDGTKGALVEEEQEC